MDNQATWIEERELLKEELHALKRCQYQYLALTITATGIVLGAAEKFVGDTSTLIYLVPLLVILPCWTIFFDKASSITRIVGYLRVLENLLAGTEIYQYIGWENALKEFRTDEQGNRNNELGKKSHQKKGTGVPKCGLLTLGKCVGIRFVLGASFLDFAGIIGIGRSLG